jgi:hypothetical protein
MQLVDFEKFDRLGSIGGAPFLQEFQIGFEYSKLDMVLTDLNPNAIRNLSYLTQLNKYTIEQWDAEIGPFERFRTCDVILMNGVDVLLTDTALARLLVYSKERECLLLIGSINRGNELSRQKKYFLRRIEFRIRKKVLKLDHKMIQTGWLRTDEYFSFLASKHQISHEVLFESGFYTCHAFGRINKIG